MEKVPKGYVIYDGASLLDGKRIVAIALTDNSKNTKTGDMVQTYIIRPDINPLEINKTGEDYSICGTCPHKGIPHSDPNRKTAKERTCYVILGQGVLIVWKQFKKGAYPYADDTMIEKLGIGRAIRIGTYGDGASVPSHIWKKLIKHSIKRTGYSHQAETKGADYDPSLYMRSVESLLEAFKAWDKGERTFRVTNVNNVEPPIEGKEIWCPADKGVQCKDCGLCAGNSIQAKSIVIKSHGAGAKYA